jgi:hypothetical protein
MERLEKRGKEDGNKRLERNTLLLVRRYLSQPQVLEHTLLRNYL